MMASLDRFNARDMSAAEVATTFVTPPDFDTLCSGNNTLVLGPRGSGKTTLLKMLTPEAVESRRQLQREDEPSPGFVGVYVPLDVQLAETLERLGGTEIDPEILAVGAEALFAFHTFRHIANTAAWFCGSAKRRTSGETLSPAHEASLVAELGELWRCDLQVPTVQTLLGSLRRRQLRATEDWRESVLASKYGTSRGVVASPVVDLDGGLKGGIEAIARHLEFTADRFAVLFDEVELAPDSLQAHLLGYLRHSEQQLQFKIAVSPYMSGARGISDRLTASPMNDYDVIDLGSLDGADVRDFSRGFFEAAARRRGLGAVTMESALGPSVLNPVSEGPNTDASYGPATSQARAIRSLARKDPSFAAYVDKMGIDPSGLVGDQTSDDRAPFRKVRQVALLRDAYLSDSQRRRIKSRTDARRLFTGAETIVKMCEGNPRRLAFMTGLVLDEIRDDGRVPRGVQMAAVESTEAAFRSFVRGIRVSKNAGSELPRGVLSFLDLLGEEFHSRIVAESFDADPVGSFIVHSTASDLVEEVVARAVNAGALIQLSSHDSRGTTASAANMAPVVTSRGKRFRLSYMLAPNYGTLTRVCRSQSLETLLRDVVSTPASGGKRRIASALLSGQVSLL